MCDVSNLRSCALVVPYEPKLHAFGHGDVGANDAHRGIVIPIHGGTADGRCQMLVYVVLVEERFTNHEASNVFKTQLVLLPRVT